MFALHRGSLAARRPFAPSPDRREESLRCPLPTPAAFERGDGSASSIPTRDSILYNGDSVLACIRHELIDQFSKYIQD